MFRRYSVSQAFALTAYFISPLPGLLRILVPNCHSVKDLLITTSLSIKKRWRVIIHNGWCWEIGRVRTNKGEQRLFRCLKLRVEAAETGGICWFVALLRHDKSSSSTPIIIVFIYFSFFFPTWKPRQYWPHALALPPHVHVHFCFFKKVAFNFRRPRFTSPLPTHFRTLSSPHTAHLLIDKTNR
jgi:hypothetical protein